VGFGRDCENEQFYNLCFDIEMEINAGLPLVVKYPKLQYFVYETVGPGGSI
jgi:hypothetical protein